MSETKIKLPGLTLNLEVIVPGIILASGLEMVGVNISALESTTFGKIQGGLLFIALSYAIGLVALLISRVIIDTSSEIGLRGLFFSVFAHSSIEELEKFYRNLDQERYDYDYKKKAKSIRLGDGVRKWNVIYRSALRAAGDNEEIKKRRSQGRIVRSLLFPASLAAFAFFKISEPIWVAGIIGFVVAYVIILFLYAYAELMNFAEAVDIHIVENKEEKNG